LDDPICKGENLFGSGELKGGLMGLWIREGKRRWERARALPSYKPPNFLHITPAKEGPAWWLSWTIGPDFGADALPELLEALIRSVETLPGDLKLQRIVEGKVEAVEEILPFSPEAVRPPGLLLQKVKVEPARWLLILYLTQSAGKVLVPREEKYLGGWWASLTALRKACRG